MKVAVLGGSFDPPHNGHLYIAKALLKQKLCQKIILMPCSKHPFHKPLTDAKHRLAMTKLLETDSIEVSSIEVKKANTSYTIDTLKGLKAQYPKDEFMWIIGEDQIGNFTKWKEWREIIEKFGLIIAPRQTRPPRGSPTATSEVVKQRLRLLGGEIRNIIFLNKKTLNPLDISSSEIRKRVKEGLSITKLVPKEVERYIISHKLYET